MNKQANMTTNDSVVMFACLFSSSIFFDSINF